MCVCTCMHINNTVLPTSDCTFWDFFFLLVFKDSSQKDLLNFTGTIPVIYQGKYGS